MNDSATLARVADGSATSTQEVVYEFARATLLTGWWTWAVALGGIGLAIYFCIWLYRRDTTELQPGVRFALLVLRLTTVCALISLFLWPTATNSAAGNSQQ